MKELRLRPDRTIDSTDNNEFANGLRDETLLAEDMLEEIPVDDRIPDGIDETGEGERPVYDEMGIDRDTE